MAETVIPEQKYTLENVDGSHQTLNFFTKHTEGTTNEEVLGVLIERLYDQQKASFSPDNKECIKHLKEVRRIFARRFQRKIDKKIERDESKYPHKKRQKVHSHAS